MFPHTKHIMTCHKPAQRDHPNTPLIEYHFKPNAHDLKQWHHTHLNDSKTSNKNLLCCTLSITPIYGAPNEPCTMLQWTKLSNLSSKQAFHTHSMMTTHQHLKLVPHNSGISSSSLITFCCAKITPLHSQLQHSCPSASPNSTKDEYMDYMMGLLLSQQTPHSALMPIQ